MLQKFYIGDLDIKSVKEEVKSDLDNMLDDKGRKVALNPKHKISFKLQAKEVLSHDSFMLDFALQSPWPCNPQVKTGGHICLTFFPRREPTMVPPLHPPS